MYLSIAHDRFGSSSHVQQNGSLSHPQDPDGPMRVTAQRKTNAYQQTYADNQNISFLPVIMSTSNRIHGEFLCLLFLQAHRETEAHFTAVFDRNRQEQHVGRVWARQKLFAHPPRHICACAISSRNKVTSNSAERGHEGMCASY